MFNKISSAVFSLTLVSLPVWATSGVYLGGGLGPEFTDFRQAASVVVQMPPRPITSNVKDTTHLSGSGVFGSVFGGYGHTWPNHFYLAGEVNVDVSSDNAEGENLEFVHGSASHTTYRMQNSVGLSLLPGYYYKDCVLFYGRVGYANGNFKTSTSDTSLANVDRHLSGFRWGLGMNTMLTEHLGARLEYSQTFYQQTQFTVVDSPATKKTQITPTTNQVEFGLIYHFA